MKKLTFWYEFASPYSYFSIMRIEKLAAEHNIDVTYQPFLLGPLFKEFGWNTSPFLIFKEKGENFRRDIEREAEFYGLPALIMPNPFPQWGVDAVRVALVGLKSEWGVEFSKAIFSRQFKDGLSIDGRENVEEVWRLIGRDDEFDAIWQQANDDKTKAQLREITNIAKNFKIFGAPSFIARNELFWGNDRLDRAISYA